MDPLQTYRENAGEINTITARRQPTFEEKVRLIKTLGAFLRSSSTSFAEYMKGNVMGRKPDGAWLDKLNIGLSQRQTPLENPRVSGREEERLYAEPKYNWELGEVDPPGGKLAKHGAEYIINPAIKIRGRVVQGDYAKGGHIEIVNKIDRDPKLKAAFDRGEYVEGATTDAGTFIGKKPDVDFSEIKGRDVSEIGELLVKSSEAKFKMKLGTWRGSVIDVYKNPTKREFQEIIKRYRDKYPNAPKGDPKSRSTIDQDGNNYFWMSGDATHEMVEAQLKIKGIVANQNNPTDFRF